MQSETTQPDSRDKKIIRWILVALVAAWLTLCLSTTSVGIGYLLGRAGNAGGAGSNEAFGPLYQTWDIIHSKYVDQPVDDTQLIQGAIDGMMKSLGDENSTYMNPQIYEAASDSLEGYEGIGASIDTSGPYLKIIAPFAGSPAEKAGLKSGDEIFKIDGVDMTGVDPLTVRDKLLGPAGSHVKVSVKRTGESELLEFDVIRAKIEPPVVESRMLENGIGYLYLGIFSDAADSQVQAALESLMENHPTGLILDLRQNPGGYVSSAIEIGSQFLPEKTLLFTEKTGDGSEKSYFTHSGGLAADIPLVVLVDGGTASAAEIVAGAIQDHGRALLVGTTTYGKGSVQEWIPLDNDMGAIRITIARWYTPSGKQISKLGLTPDVEVTYSEEQFQAGEDPQLDRAIELLK